MIITLILIVLFLFCWALYVKADGYFDEETFPLVGMFVIGTLLTISLAVVLIVRITRDVEYEKMLNEREIIEYRLELIEQDELDTYAEIQLYSDIVSYNRRIIDAQRWASNPWTSWFFNQKIADMDIIILPERGGQ